MGTPIATAGYTYLVDPPTVLCTVIEVGTPSAKNKAGGDGMLLDEHELQITAITNPPSTIPDPGPYSLKFAATATKVKDIGSGKMVLVNGDETNQITASPQTPGSPPVTVPVQIKYTIIVPGQINATAN